MSPLSLVPALLLPMLSAPRPVGAAPPSPWDLAEADGEDHHERPPGWD
jgi:hypothetical protein